MSKLKEDNAESYKKQFGRFAKAGIKAEDLENIYTNAHKTIRAEPFKKRGPLERGFFQTRKTPKDPKAQYPKKAFNQKPISVQQRKSRIRNMLLARGAKELIQEHKI